MAILFAGCTPGEPKTGGLEPPPGDVVAIVLSADSIALGPAQTYPFRASGRLSDGTMVNGVPVTWEASGGTISSTGSYTSGQTPGRYQVIATQQGGTEADTSLVIIQAATVTLLQLVLNPGTVTLAPGGTGQFSVAGSWSDGSTAAPAVTYSATGGTITAGGLYTAGATAGTYQVIATQQGGTLADTSTVTVTAAPSTTLRILAAARNFAVGAAVNMEKFRADAQYQQLLAAQYNSVVAENAMKFSVIHPAQAQYSFTDADQFVSFAQANGMRIHGHTLVWNGALPPWITGGTFTKAQLLQVEKDHITTVVGRYAGKIASWDVVNEVVAWNGTLLPDIWLNTIGPEYIDSAFVWTHRVDPSAKLYLNDYSIEAAGAKSDGVLALVQRLKSSGIPIDGVGFQSHAFPGGPLPTRSALSANFTRFTNAGFDIRVSEIDVMIADTAGPAALVAQATVYRDALDACLLLARCTGFTTWGMTDRYSWIPAFWPGYGRGLPFDANYQPKPAFDSLAARLRRP